MTAAPLWRLYSVSSISPVALPVPLCDRRCPPPHPRSHERPGVTAAMAGAASAVTPPLLRLALRCLSLPSGWRLQATGGGGANPLARI